MNICKGMQSHSSKWYNAATKVRAIYRSVTGNISIVGRMSELFRLLSSKAMAAK
jgi:hypothetical protein